MSALDLIRALSQGMFVVVFILVAWRTARQVTPAHIDMTIFFGILAFIVVESRVVEATGLTAPELVSDVIAALVIALPYIVLRLVDDFRVVPRWLKRGAELCAVTLALAAFALPGPMSPALALAIVVYFAALAFYCGAMFTLAARRTQGVTKRRMQAISLGTIAIGLDIVVAGLARQLPEPDRSVVSAGGQLLALGAAAAFYLGFAPPAILRRAWQAPELRLFMTRASELPRLPRTLDIVRALESGAAASTGSQARIALWLEDERRLRMWIPGTDEPYDIEAGRHFAGRAFEQQRTFFSADPVREDPQGAELYRRMQIGAVIAAPITAGERRLGVLVLFAERPPIFTVSDTELAQIIADQAAVILESRALIDQAASVRAQEEATRLKEEFVSAAAHDLKTPLTTVVAQAQFLERKARRDPSAPADLQGLQRIVREGQRLATLVAEMLDAARLERGALLAERETVDLGAVVREIVTRQESDMHPCDVEVNGAVVGTYDRRRIEQLVENLVENAKKYSPEATPVHLAVWRENGEARISVRDQGIGIPPSDLPRIFDRFSRASNVADRRFHGMGLGLYICRGIVEEHGGRIWVESELGKSTTFHVALPART